MEIRDWKEYADTVSIIVPVYNAGRFLAETIEMVQKQTYADWELLLVDDCSADDSMEIAKRYAAQDDRIHPIIQERNVGAACTRNAGIGQAKGRFLCFLDADDIWLSLHTDQQTGGVKIAADFLRRGEVGMLVQIILTKIIVKSLYANLISNGNAHKITHFLQAAAVAPVCFKEQAPDTLCIYNITNEFQCLLWNFKTAPGVDDFENAEFSRYMGQDFGVKRCHFFFIPGVVQRIVTEAAFAPEAGKTLQQDNFTLVFICNSIIPFHWLSVLSR